MRLLISLVLLPSLLAACGGTNAGAPPTADAGAQAMTAADAATETPTPDDAGSTLPDGGAAAADAGAADAGPTDAQSRSQDAGDADASDAAPHEQAMAIPMYMDPSAADWAQETRAASDVPLLVANPNSGPGTSADSSYSQAIAAAHSAGQTIIGYIHTSYGARAIADVEADIDTWYSFYPAIDGIFSDETATDASLVSSYYAPLYAYVKAKGGGGFRRH